MKSNNKGFTLLEVMVASAVLSLGIVFIFQSFFSVLRSYDYCQRYIASSAFAHEKLWQAADSVRRDGVLPAETGGEFFRGGKRFEWNLFQEPVGDKLYKVAVLVKWVSGKQTREVERLEYAAYESPE